MGNWKCHPGITLPAGTYSVIDPIQDMVTKTMRSGKQRLREGVAGSQGKKYALDVGGAL